MAVAHSDERKTNNDLYTTYPQNLLNLYPVAKLAKLLIAQ
jgi:hypothetical protein